MIETWICDDRGNKCSVEYFGSREAAKVALQSLNNCNNSINCSYCSGCKSCSCCSYCSYCKSCSYCSCCSYCSRLTKEENNEAIPPVPVIENIHRKIFEAVSKPSALSMDAYHTCNTTHCRAGWIVHLAGDAGYALELFHNAELAAMLIYKASGYEINPARFYDSNKAAMKHMRELANQRVVEE